MKNLRFLFYGCCVFVACKLGNKNVPLDLESVKFLRQNNPDSFLLYAKNELKKSNQQPLEKSNILTQLGHYYYDNLALDSAYEYYQKALTIREQIGNIEAIANSMASMGDIISEKGSYDSAIVFYNNAIKNRTNNENLCDDYNNIAGLYANNGQNNLAQISFNQAVKIASKMNDSLRLSKSFFNLALYNYSNNVFDSALYYLNIAEQNKKYSNLINKKLNFILAKANIYFGLGNNIKANVLYDSALQYSFKHNLKNERLNIIQSKIVFLNKQGNLKACNELLYWQVELSDSLFSENIQTSISQLQVKYDTERKKAAIEKLNKENSFQKYIISGFSFGIVMLLILLFFVHKNEKNKRKKTLAETNLNINKILEEVNQTKMEAWADGQEKERGRIAAELHDRLGGLLVMASHHFTNIEKKFDTIKKENETAFTDFRKIINNAIIEVRELSKDISSNLVSKLGISNAMLDLKEKLESATQLKINLNTHNAEAKIPLSKEIALFRVAQEALNNVMKHANASEIQISLIGNEKSMVLMIEDNGKGFENNSYILNVGMGLKSMHKRMVDIGGTLTIDTKLQRGTIIVAELVY